jgi:hypothetical protein
LDCISDDYSFQFDIVRATDSADLVFGRHRVFDKSDFRFYSLKGADTTFYELRHYGYGLNAPEDSILSVWFYPETDTVFMRFSSTDIDTLVMSFETRKTKCCGTITEITNFRLNDKIDMPGGEGTQLIKK